MTKPFIGTVGPAKEKIKVSIDIPRLLETRLLIQANSGGGKSWTLRRIIEQIVNHVQVLVIDPEGEFSTLREKYDFVICSQHDGDALAHPRTAAMLAKRLLETGVSAVLDIYDLKAHERQAFVRLFLDALVNAPKKLWRPVCIILDEAHVYAPEKGKSESTGAVIDVATRGRKRGQCLITATQRLSKLHKDVAAECINKLIGRTGLDIDVKRAADELGMSPKEATQTLRNFNEGEFFVFGPAFTREVTRILVGPVVTRHPKVGQRLIETPPAPSAKIKKVLAKLADLPKEAEREAKSLAELKTENARIRRDLTIALRKADKTGIPEQEVQKRIAKAVAKIKREKVVIPGDSKKLINEVERVLARHRQKAGQEEKQVKRESVVTDTTLRKGARRMLQQLAAAYPDSLTRNQLGMLADISPTSGTFTTYLGDIRALGYLYESGPGIATNDAGIEYLGSDIPSKPATHDEIMSQWKRKLRAGACRMLQAIVDAGPEGITRNEIADAANISVTSGTFTTYLGDLKKPELIRVNRNNIVASESLFP